MKLQEFLELATRFHEKFSENKELKKLIIIGFDQKGDSHFQYTGCNSTDIILAGALLEQLGINQVLNRTNNLAEIHGH